MKDETIRFLKCSVTVAALIFGARLSYQFLLYETVASPEAFSSSGFLMEGM
jgi:hypothetical protein